MEWIFIMAKLRKKNLAIETYTSNQVNLMNTFRKLWEQHIMWTRSFIISTASNLGDLPMVTNRLLQNPSDFASVLMPFYGRENAARFQSLFQEHLLIAAKLVNDAKAGNTAAVKEGEIKWYENADEIAAFLASINSFWSEQEWKALLYDHLKMTENEAVQRLNGNYEEDIMQYDSIQDEALKMADLMSMGIIKQFKYR